jgi:glutathione S-transferase
MLTLHGFAVSHFYNMVQHSLLEKGIKFEEVLVVPGQDPDFLSKSPMGKVPCLETPNGFLAETNVILDYLEDAFPLPSLMPPDPFSRARARQVMKMVELYIEIPARRHLASTVFSSTIYGAKMTEQAREEVRPAVDKGLKAFAQLAELTPYIIGDEFSLADIFSWHAFSMVARVMRAAYDWDIVAEVPGLAATFDLIRSRDISQQIATEHESALSTFLAQISN